MVFTRTASERVPMFQPITSPSKQSIMGDKYIFPAKIWNLRDVGKPLLIRGSRLEAAFVRILLP